MCYDDDIQAIFKDQKVNESAPELTIRPYRQSDESRVKELTIMSFDGVSIDQNFDKLVGWNRSPAWEDRKWAGSVEVLRSFPENSFVAELDGRVVGYVSCTISHSSQIGRIVDLAVDHAHRRQRIASLLIEAALESFRNHGMTIAKIETLRQNRASQSLYPKFGFKQVAHQIHYMMELAPEDED